MKIFAKSSLLWMIHRDNLYLIQERVKISRLVAKVSYSLLLKARTRHCECWTSNTRNDNEAFMA